MPSLVTVVRESSGKLKIHYNEWISCFMKTRFETVPLMKSPYEINPWVRLML